MQIDFKNKLIEQHQVSNDKYDYLRSLNKLYTKKVRSSQKNQTLDKIQPSHREKMRRVQNASPIKVIPDLTAQRRLPDLSARRKTAHGPLKSLFHTDEQILQKH